MALQDIRPAVLGQVLRPNIWDVVALVLVIGAMVLIVYSGEQTVAPLSTLDIAPMSLDPANSDKGIVPLDRQLSVTRSLWIL